MTFNHRNLQLVRDQLTPGHLYRDCWECDGFHPEASLKDQQIQSLAVAIIAPPEADHNGSFQYNHMKRDFMWLSRYQVLGANIGNRIGLTELPIVGEFIRGNSNPSGQIGAILKKAKAVYPETPIKHLLIAGHGTEIKTDILLGRANWLQAANIKSEDFDALDSDATICLHSCNTGKEGGIAEELCRKTQRTVFAPDNPSYGIDAFHYDPLKDNIREVTYLFKQDSTNSVRKDSVLSITYKPLPSNFPLERFENELTEMQASDFKTSPQERKKTLSHLQKLKEEKDVALHDLLKEHVTTVRFLERKRLEKFDKNINDTLDRIKELDTSDVFLTFTHASNPSHFLSYSSEHGWQIIHLNFFEQLLRAFFGFYASTHLKTVLEQLEKEQEKFKIKAKPVESKSSSKPGWISWAKSFIISSHKTVEPQPLSAEEIVLKQLCRRMRACWKRKYQQDFSIPSKKSIASA